MQLAAARIFLFVFIAAAAGCGSTASMQAVVDGQDLGSDDTIDDAGDNSTDDGAAPIAGDLAMKGGSRDMAGVAPICNGGITLTPANALLYVDGVHQFSLGFHALCGNFDVGPNAAFSIDNAMLGAFAGPTFTSAAGASGSSTVRVSYMGKMASATLTLQVTTVVIAPGTDGMAPKKFGGANDANLAPTWAYPDDGVLIPPNLSELEFQFLPKGNTLFELGFSGGGVNLKVYTKCDAVGNGCGYTLDVPTWQLLSSVARGSTITVSLRGTSGASVGTAAPRKLRFSDEDVTGGLYYWAAASGSIIRYDFGLRGQKGEAFYTQADAGGICVGCHALSRDGSRIAVGLNIPGPAGLRVVDVATKKTIFSVGNGFGFGAGSNYQTFTSDGKTLVTTEGGGLTIRDASTGNLVGAMTQVANANMPDLAPDNSEVVFSRGQNTCMFGICNTLSSVAAGIYSVPFTGKGFGAVKNLVPIANGQTNYYPSYSPDGKFVLFNRAAADSNDAKDALLLAVPTAGGKVVPFAGLNAVPGNTWPKWAPFSHHFNGSTIFWFTFSSTRPFGLRGGTEYQLWMTGVDTAQLQAGADGAFPAFRLPFQDAATGNHISQWAQKVARTPCGGLTNVVPCGAGEICAGGFCQPKP